MEDYHSMKRKELQALCKKHNIPAGSANSVLADKLSQLLNVQEKQKPITRQRACLKSRVETTDEGEPEVSKREAKNVKFCPTNDLFEYELSSVKKQQNVVRKTGARRNSVAKKVGNPVVDNDNRVELVEDAVQTPVRLTRSRVHILEKDDVVPNVGRRQGRSAAKDVVKEKDVNEEPKANVGKPTRSKVHVSGKCGAVQLDEDKQSKRPVKGESKASESVEEPVVIRDRVTRSKAQSLMDADIDPDMKLQDKKKSGRQVAKAVQLAEPAKEVVDIPARITRTRGQTVKEDIGNTVTKPQAENKRTRKEMKATDQSSNSSNVALEDNQEHPKRQSLRTREVEVEDADEVDKVQMVDNRQVTRSRVTSSSISKTENKVEAQRKSKRVQQLEEPLERAVKKNAKRRESATQPVKIEVVPHPEEPVDTSAGRVTRRKSIMQKAQGKEIDPEKPEVVHLEKPVSSPAARVTRRKSLMQKAHSEVTDKPSFGKNQPVEETEMPDSPKTIGGSQSIRQSGSLSMIREGLKDKEIVIRSGKDASDDKMKAVTISTISPKSKKRRGTPIIEDGPVEPGYVSPVEFSRRSVRGASKSEGKAVTHSLQNSAKDQLKSGSKTCSPGGAVGRDGSSKKRAKLSIMKKKESEDHGEKSNIEKTPISKPVTSELGERVIENEHTPAIVGSHRRFTRSALGSNRKEPRQTAIKQQPIGDVHMSSDKVPKFRQDSAVKTAPGRVTRSGIKQAGTLAIGLSERVDKKKQQRESAHQRKPFVGESGRIPDVVIIGAQSEMPKEVTEQILGHSGNISASESMRLSAEVAKESKSETAITMESLSSLFDEQPSGVESPVNFEVETLPGGHSNVKTSLEATPDAISDGCNVQNQVALDAAESVLKSGRPKSYEKELVNLGSTSKDLQSDVGAEEPVISVGMTVGMEESDFFGDGNCTYDSVSYSQAFEQPGIKSKSEGEEETKNAEEGERGSAQKPVMQEPVSEDNNVHGNIEKLQNCDMANREVSHGELDREMNIDDTVVQLTAGDELVGLSASESTRLSAEVAKESKSETAITMESLSSLFDEQHSGVESPINFEVETLPGGHSNVKTSLEATPDAISDGCNVQNQVALDAAVSVLKSGRPETYEKELVNLGSTSKDLQSDVGAEEPVISVGMTVGMESDFFGDGNCTYDSVSYSQAFEQPGIKSKSEGEEETKKAEEGERGSAQKPVMQEPVSEDNNVHGNIEKLQSCDMANREVSHGELDREMNKDDTVVQLTAGDEFVGLSASESTRLSAEVAKESKSETAITMESLSSLFDEQPSGVESPINFEVETLPGGRSNVKTSLEATLDAISNGCNVQNQVALDAAVSVLKSGRPETYEKELVNLGSTSKDLQSDVGAAEPVISVGMTVGMKESDFFGDGNCTYDSVSYSQAFEQPGIKSKSEGEEQTKKAEEGERGSAQKPVMQEPVSEDNNVHGNIEKLQSCDMANREVSHGELDHEMNKDDTVVQLTAGDELVGLSVEEDDTKDDIVTAYDSLAKQNVLSMGKDISFGLDMDGHGVANDLVDTVKEPTQGPELESVPSIIDVCEIPILGNMPSHGEDHVPSSVEREDEADKANSEHESNPKTLTDDKVCDTTTSGIDDEYNVSRLSKPLTDSSSANDMHETPLFGKDSSFGLATESCGVEDNLIDAGKEPAREPEFEVAPSTANDVHKMPSLGKPDGVDGGVNATRESDGEDLVLSGEGEGDDADNTFKEHEPNSKLIHDGVSDTSVLDKDDYDNITRLFEPSLDPSSAIDRSGVADSGNEHAQDHEFELAPSAGNDVQEMLSLGESDSANASKECETDSVPSTGGNMPSDGEPHVLSGGDGEDQAYNTNKEHELKLKQFTDDVSDTSVLGKCDDYNITRLHEPTSDPSTNDIVETPFSVKDTFGESGNPIYDQKSTLKPKTDNDDVEDGVNNGRKELESGLDSSVTSYSPNVPVLGNNADRNGHDGEPEHEHEQLTRIDMCAMGEQFVGRVGSEPDQNENITEDIIRSTMADDAHEESPQEIDKDAVSGYFGDIYGIENAVEVTDTENDNWNEQKVTRTFEPDESAYLKGGDSNSTGMNTAQIIEETELTIDSDHAPSDKKEQPGTTIEEMEDGSNSANSRLVGDLKAQETPTREEKKSQKENMEDWGNYSSRMDGFQKLVLANNKDNLLAKSTKDDQVFDLQSSARASSSIQESSSPAADMVNSVNKLEHSSKNVTDRESDQNVDLLKGNANMLEEDFNCDWSDLSLKSLFTTPAATQNDFKGENTRGNATGEENEICGVPSFEHFSNKYFENEVDGSIDWNGKNKHLELKGDQFDLSSEAASTSNHHESSVLNVSSMRSGVFGEKDSQLKGSETGDNLAFDKGT